APALTNLRKALEDCQRFAGFLRQKIEPMRPVQGADEHTSEESAGAAPAGAGAPAAIASRADAYRQLERVAAELERLEPHSPVPYLIRRAVKLGSMPFHVLIRELLRDEERLAQLGR